MGHIVSSSRRDAPNVSLPATRAGPLPVTAEAQRALEEAAGWLILLDDDIPDPDQRARFQAWVDASPAHAQAWANVNRTSGLLAEAPYAMAPLVRARPSAIRLAVASVSALVAACLVLTLAPGLLLKLQADATTGTAEIRTVHLEDGSTVRLGPDSAIAVTHHGDSRSIALLAGEAFFDVQHDPKRPFKVTARGWTVTDIGTRFDVNMREATTAVAVNRGQVRVDRDSQSYSLQAGDWVRLDSVSSTQVGSGLNDDVTEGPSTRIAARNTSVSAMIDALRPWFAGRIVIADASVGTHFVTGVFDATDPTRALQALVSPAGGRVIRLTPWLLIVTRE